MYCGYCHNAPTLAERPFASFQNVASHMRNRANLTGKEYALLMEFLRRWNDVPPPHPPMDPSPKRLTFSQQIAELRPQAPAKAPAPPAPPAAVPVPPAGVAVPPAGVAVPPAGVPLPPAAPLVPPAGVALPPAGLPVPPAAPLVLSDNQAENADSAPAAPWVVGVGRGEDAP
jgi:hypothetical protein